MQRMITCSAALAVTSIHVPCQQRKNSNFILGKQRIEGFEVKWDSDDFPFGYEFS